MAVRPESTSKWSFGGGSIWQSGHQTARSGFDHNWRGWQGIDHSHEQRLEQRPRPSPLLPSLSQPDADPGLSSTLYMGDLEPWMDHEYASQVVNLMGWDRTSNSNGIQSSAVTIKIPPPPSDAVPQPNNPGYCLLTFPSAAHAANVLASLQSNNLNTAPPLMPNSSRPFNLQWAESSQLLSGGATSAFLGQSQGGGPSNGTGGGIVANQGQQREFSIFVGDLAPETSNSDLVAVFRNPVLGLRNDREPKFIRPFYSCKSAKIMLDPVTGVSRGYGFVRFTEEADQQRALIEMHGLYCLSRPMRVSPATAKFKPNPAGPTFPPPSQPTSITLSFPAPMPAIHAQAPEDDHAGFNNGKSNAGLVRSVSSPVAAPITPSAASTSVINNSSASSAPTPAPSSSRLDANSASPPSDHPSQSQGDPQNPHVLTRVAQVASGLDWNSTRDGHFGNSDQQATGLSDGGIGSYPSSSSVTSQPPPYPGQAAVLGVNASASMPETRGGVQDESWTHQAQARAILGNLIGPNGEQLTSTDPYNTTVFVGGLSPLISEETLRTFFAPFGDIHYVKVPLGKHCGFVQFVRKADAERAIERMQGFPIGGSRIRLSWGRSQYKAAQAAAQAAQAAQAEQATRLSAAAAAATNAQNQTSLQITPDQARMLLQSLVYNPPVDTSLTGGNPMSGFGGPGLPTAFSDGNPVLTGVLNGAANSDSDNPYTFMSADAHQRAGFSPFVGASATNGLYNGHDQQLHNPLMTPSPSLPLPHPSRSYAPGFGPSPSSVSGKYSDTNSPHSSATDSSSGSSSVRFSVLGSGGFPSSAFLDNPSATFQVSDILRHDSQTLLPSGRVSSSSSQSLLQSQSQDLSTRATPPRHQRQSHDHGLRNDTSCELHDVNGTLASLDLGEAYPRASGTIGGEMKDGYSHGEERRPIPASISAPLRNLVSPRPKSGGSPEST